VSNLATKGQQVITIAKADTRLGPAKATDPANKGRPNESETLKCLSIEPRQIMRERESQRYGDR